MRTRPTLELALRDLSLRSDPAETTVSTGRKGCQREGYRRKNDCRSPDSRPEQENPPESAINLKLRLSVLWAVAAGPPPPDARAPADRRTPPRVTCGARAPGRPHPTSPRSARRRRSRASAPLASSPPD